MDAIRAVVPGFTYEEGGAPRPDRFARIQPLDLSPSHLALGYAPELDLVAGLRDLHDQLADRPEAA